MKTLENFIFNKMKKGSLTFSLQEVMETLALSYEDARTALYRYKTKGKIALIRRGFYVIIPPEYSQKGMLPIYLYVDDMMKSIEKPYYLALFSAAATYGAAHQQPMTSYIMTIAPKLLSIKNNKHSIIFLTKQKWDESDIVKKKSPAGYFNISSPELTAIDLIAYMAISGINRCATVIEELIEFIDSQKLFETALRFKVLSVLQRLGYLLDVELKHAELSDSIYKALSDKKLFFVPLSIHHDKKGDFNSKWKIIKNTEIEIDL